MKKASSWTCYFFPASLFVSLAKGFTAILNYGITFSLKNGTRIQQNKSLEILHVLKTV